MNISKEAKIGISALVVIVMVYWGINFLKGMNVLEGKDTYYISMNDASGMVVSTAVMAKGVKIGSVADVELIEMQDDIVVELIIDTDYKIPSDSYLTLLEGAIMDAPKLVLMPGRSLQMLHDNDTIPFKFSPSMMQSISMLSTKLASVLDRVDTLIGSVNSVMSENTIHNINETFANLNSATENANDLIISQKDRLDRIMNNVDNITKTFNEATPELKATLANIEGMTGTLSASLPGILSDIEEILSKTTSPDGTVGKLLNNDDLYNNLDTTLVNLAALLEDLKNNPKDYVRFSVFEKLSPAEKAQHKVEKEEIRKKKLEGGK